MVQRKWVDISKPTQMAHIHLVKVRLQIKVVPKCRKARWLVRCHQRKKASVAKKEN
jgi:hypothetical protein